MVDINELNIQYKVLDSELRGKTSRKPGFLSTNTVRGL